MTRTALLLFVSSCGTAVIHALIPDHWLPFVLMARSERWALRRAAALTGLAGTLHVAVSLVFGALAIRLGSATAETVAAHTGRSLDFLGAFLLFVFGVTYGLWRHVRERRAHREGGAGRGHIHAHGHLLERWFHATPSAAALVLVIGISPCALLVPILFASAVEGTGVLAAAALGFAVCTIGTMVVVTVLALRGLDRVELPFFTRYGDLVSGGLVAAIGAVMMLHDV